MNKEWIKSVFDLQKNVNELIYEIVEGYADYNDHLAEECQKAKDKIEEIIREVRYKDKDLSIDLEDFLETDKNNEQNN